MAGLEHSASDEVAEVLFLVVIAVAVVCLFCVCCGALISVCGCGKTLTSIFTSLFSACACFDSKPRTDEPGCLANLFTCWGCFGLCKPRRRIAPAVPVARLVVPDSQPAKVVVAEPPDSPELSTPQREVYYVKSATLPLLP